MEDFVVSAFGGAAFAGEGSSVNATAPAAATPESSNNPPPEDCFRSAAFGIPPSATAYHASAFGGRPSTPDGSGELPAGASADGVGEALENLQVGGSDSDDDDDLVVACQRGDEDFVSVFSRVSAQHPDEWRDDAGATALWNAAWLGHARCIQLLVAARGGRADVNAARDDGTTPLYIACQGGHTATVEVLLAAGATVDAPIDEAGVQTSLRVASELGHASIVEVLLQHGAIQDGLSPDDDPPIWRAAQAGNGLCIKHLLAAGADVNRGPECSPLAKACHMGHSECAFFLIDASADLDCLSAAGVSALFLSVCTACFGDELPDSDEMDVDGALECVELLLAMGADADPSSDSVIQGLEIAREIAEAGPEKEAGRRAARCVALLEAASSGPRKHKSQEDARGGEGASSSRGKQQKRV